jgi:hypothetical protein
VPRSGAITLSDVISPSLTLICKPCARKGVYSVAMPSCPTCAASYRKIAQSTWRSKASIDARRYLIQCRRRKGNGRRGRAQFLSRQLTRSLRRDGDHVGGLNGRVLSDHPRFLPNLEAVIGKFHPARLEDDAAFFHSFLVRKSR